MRKALIVENAVIAVVGSLVGVTLGMLGNLGLARRQERAQRLRDAAAADQERAVERRRVAGRIADGFLAPLRALRSLDARYLQELVVEVFLPKRWYENYEPALLRVIGDLDDEDARSALLDVVTLLGERDLFPDYRAGYHYVEAQLRLGLEIAQALARGESLPERARAEVAALRERKAELDEYGPRPRRRK